MKIILNLKKTIINTFAIIGISPDFCSVKLEKKISELLVKNNLKISTAESCTGGLISSRLTDISGSSDYINQNFITYSNESKEKYLGVSQISIIENGVVSKEVASQMAIGLLNASKCDIALSTTGIAGPTGGSSKKPVGMIFISVAGKNKVKTVRFCANKFLSRRIMKYVFSQVALKYLLKFLKENY